MRSQHAEVEPSKSATTEQTEQAEKSDQAIPEEVDPSSGMDEEETGEETA